MAKVISNYLSNENQKENGFNNFVGKNLARKVLVRPQLLNSRDLRIWLELHGVIDTNIKNKNRFSSVNKKNLDWLKLTPKCQIEYESKRVCLLGVCLHLDYNINQQKCRGNTEKVWRIRNRYASKSDKSFTGQKRLGKEKLCTYKNWFGQMSRFNLKGFGFINRSTKNPSFRFSCSIFFGQKSLFS